MTKIKRVKREKKSNEFGNNFVAFGNKKSVFWSITFATIILSLISIPLIILYKDILEYFLVVWILEIIYIAMYKKSKNYILKNNHN
jgi:hypothetical protein